MTNKPDTLKVSQILCNAELRSFVSESFSFVLKNIGLSDQFCNDLTSMLYDLTPPAVLSFREKYEDEILSVYKNNFFGKLIPNFFKEYIFAHVADGLRILDYGCGSGELSYTLARENTNSIVTGIDIIESENWRSFLQANLSYRVFKPVELSGIIKKTKPDIFICTWVLHHMDLQQQRSLFSTLANHATDLQLYILEDSFSTNLKPKHWPKVATGFESFNQETKKEALFVYDWVTNNILAGRFNLNMPKTYQSIEEWIELASKYGFIKEKINYIGIPDLRDNGSPQALIILKQKAK
ncbi:MAG: class I SAM-dependent methyltransferase [Colwellia sp.]